MTEKNVLEYGILSFYNGINISVCFGGREVHSCCGLDCTRCDAFIATQNNDDELRAKVAEAWSRLYNAPIIPEHIHCTGCRSNGVKTYYCEHMCEIRRCSLGKGLNNCAGCGTYACDKLRDIFRLAPEAKKTLDELRAKLLK